MKFIIDRKLLQPMIASPGASYYTIAVILRSISPRSAWEETQGQLERV